MQLIGKNLKKTLNFSGLIYSAKKMFDFLSDSASKSIDYVETLNLFEVSMGKTLNNYGELDSVSSKYYTKALKFQNQLNETFGTNIEETMRYQALFNQMSKSMGVADNPSYVISENLTKLGIDLASLFNKSETDTMEALRAGVLAGQTKPLRTLGMDVTEQTLKTYADNLGIEKSISDFSQAEKIILRYIAVLNQAGAAQGDFARTIESPSNQLKVFKQQFTELKVAIGNLFQGLLGQILPIANGIIMAIKEIINAIGIIFGFKVSSSNSNLAEQVGIDELDDGLSSAVGSAKELKAQLMGFDEINNITTETSSGGGGGSVSPVNGIDDKLLKSLGEYDNLMGNVKMKATEIRDKIMDWLGFTKIINPLTGDVSFKLKEGWTNLKKIWTIIKGLIGLSIAAKIISLIGNLTKLWNILKTTSTATSSFATGWKAISGIFKNIGTSIGNTFTYFSYYKSLGATTGEAFAEATKQGLGLLTTTTKLVVGLGGLAVSLYGAYDSMNDFSSGTKSAGKAFTELGISVGGAAASGALIGSIFPGVGTAVGAVTGAVLGLITASIGYESEAEKSIKLHKESLKELEAEKEGWQNIKNAVQETLDTQLSEVDYSNLLLEELNKLVDANGRVKEGYESRVSFILNELNQAYGTEYALTEGRITQNGELIAGLEDINKCILEQIENKKAQILLEANESIYAEAIKKKAQAYAELSEKTKLQQKAQEDYNKALEEQNYWEDYYDKQSPIRNINLMKASKNTSDYYKALQLANEEVKVATENYTEYSGTIIKYENLSTAILTGSVEEKTKAIEAYTNSFNTESGKRELTLSEELEMTIQDLEIMKQIYKENGKEITANEEEIMNNRLKIVGDKLVEQTNLLKNVTPELAKDWKTLAATSYTTYLEAFNGLDNDTKNIVKKVVEGITTETSNGKIPLKKQVSELRSTFNLLGDDYNFNPLINIKTRTSLDVSSLSSPLQKLRDALDVEYSSTPKIDLAISRLNNLRNFGFAYASGGFPSVGEIFLANEAGPEIVGKIGSRTAVSNTSQIVEAIEGGVYRAMRASNSSGTTNVQLDIRADEGIIVKKAAQGFSEYVQQTGELPFPVPI